MRQGLWEPGEAADGTGTGTNEHQSVASDAWAGCQAPEGKNAPAENLGQVVFGERIRSSPYEIFFNKESGKCKTVCTKEYDSSKKDDNIKLDFLKKGMSMNYQHHWIVDNMPVSDN